MDENRGDRTGRRTFLKGLGAGAGLLLPFIRQLEARAAGNAPMRFIFMYTPNGMNLKEGNGRTFAADAKSETSYTFRESMKPFDAPEIRPYISVLQNLTLKNGHPGSEGHGNASAILTCKTQSGRINNWLSGGPSFDNVLARKLGADPLSLGVCMTFALGNRLLWDDAGKASSVSVDPRKELQGMFGSMPGAPPAAGAPSNGAGQIGNRKKVHDLLVQEIKEFRKRIPTAERDGLDLYLQKVENLEPISKPPVVPVGEAATCSKPNLDALVSINSQRDVVALGEMNMNLIVSAFACGLKQVATLQWGESIQGPNIGNPAAAADHHSCSHWFSEEPALEDRIKCDTAFAGQFVKLLGKLKAVPEGDGTLLDSTIVVWGSECSDAHDSDNMTWVVAGGKHTGLNSGRYFSLNNASVADLWVSVQKKFGIQSEAFGDPQFCSGGLKNVFPV